MITFSNGHTIDFVAASGALGFDGRGYFWEAPFRWAGLLRPEDLTVIIKTLTFDPRVGNLKMWCPWRSVRLVEDGSVVNAIGLTNPGLAYWLSYYYPRIHNEDYKIIVSLCPFTVGEAEAMAKAFQSKVYHNLVGIELNFSCPNVDHSGVYNPVEIAKTFRQHSKHPLIGKVSYEQLHLCKELDEHVDAFDAINTILWNEMYSYPSPLKKYGLQGGVSGRRIRQYARYAIERIKALECTKPVITGGGIETMGEVLFRRDLGADAYSFGSLFLRKPWVPNQIVRDCRSAFGNGGV